jgi:outer membrane protein assembly factor BamA
VAPTRSFARGDPQGPPRPGLVKRAIESFFSDNKKEGPGLHFGPFAPRVVVVSSGAGPAPMLHFWAPDIGGTRLDIHASASYSIFKYQYYDLQVGLVPNEEKHLPRVERGTSGFFPLSDLEKTAAVPGFNVYASARFRDYPREDFYGIGSASLRSDHTGYRLKDTLYQGVVRYRIGHFSFMGRAGLLETAIRPGTESALTDAQISYDETTAPGLFRSPDFVTASVGAWLERRDEPDNPHRGISLGASLARFEARHHDAFHFNRLVVDAREYIPLGSKRHVVALRQVTSLDDPDAGSKVPFYLQSTLGGSTFLRGYSSFRFRDDKLLAFVGEYRFELVPKVELALLYETAKVFPTMGDFGLRNLRRSYGAGVRLKSPKKVRLRLDVLHSVESTRVHVKLDPSF